MSEKSSTSGTTTDARSSHRSRKALAIAALVVAAGAFGYLALGNIGENLVYYYSPTELVANKDKAEGASIRLGGLVADGSLVQNAAENQGLILQFSVTDGDTTVPVEARAVPPAMFREGVGVVVEGTLRADGVFETRRLMVKHDNEYRAPEDGEAKSMEQLMKTMQFDTSDT